MEDMLELKNIKKDYPAGEGIVHALKGISLQFRKSEFVSILGQSGCGKTTMLNIIGGLDQYTDGDLIINGKSTKNFRDRDWDTYRNHSVGFVFQSYNLIPHQTVLQNVELALTLSCVAKSERRERAKKALEQVGLSTQLYKKPGEMSGGQMQRVAIARALVNDPDIILADEPTGALDTETSIQVMEILKEVAKDRLVVMVTHNPELAEKYSTRIIRMLDGEIIDDSAPLTDEEVKEANKHIDHEGEKVKKPSMSFATSFSLSLKNLFTKKGRTILTSFAGSIGIIGIALIFAVSQGFSTYINIVQENALSSYPLSIESTHVDLTSIMETFMNMGNSETSHDNDAVYSDPALYDIVDALNNAETSENDLKSFKAYIEKERADEDSESGLHDAISGVQYSYDLDMLIYTENVDGTIIRSDTNELMQDLVVKYMGVDMSAMTDSSSLFSGNSTLSSIMSNTGMSSGSLWQELLPGDDGKAISDLLDKQYDVVYGSWPNSYDEIVLVLDENNELDDMTLYALGLESEDEVAKIFDAALNQKDVEHNDQKWSYEDICNMEFKAVLNSDCFTYNEETGTYSDLRNTEAGLQYLYDNAIPLKVTGIIRPSEDADSTMLSGSICYTSKLTEYVINNTKDNDAVNAQLDNKNTDIFTGLPFKSSTGDMSDADKEKDFRDYISGLDEGEKATTYISIMSIPSDEELDASVAKAKAGLTRADMETQLTRALTEQMGMAEEEVEKYISNMETDEVDEIYTALVTEQVKAQYAQQVQAQLGQMSTQQLSASLDAAMKDYTTEQCAKYYDEIMTFSESTYEENLRELGYVDLDDPATINLYAATFEDKETIEAAIDNYNEDVDEISKITYTDYVGIMMSSVTSIVNTITYVLVAFVAISLIVSSIMIGVITLISVQERTKEIGILRAIGASKHDVSSMFNAETLIIGFTSGTLGVLVTYLLCIPINLIIHNLTGIYNLNAYLPIPIAIILVLISMLLTLISGFIPSKSAAKKDPVVALRSE